MEHIYCKKETQSAICFNIEISHRKKYKVGLSKERFT